MFLKSVVVIFAIVATAYSASIHEEFDPVAINQYELVIGDFDPIPLRIQPRQRRAAEENDKGSVSVDVNRGPGGGTNLDAQGRANIYTSDNGRTTVDAHGQYQRQYGGSQGTSRLNYNYGVGFKHRF